MANTSDVHDDMKLFITPEKFLIEPTINPKEVLIIERANNKAYVLDRSKFLVPVDQAYRPICGVLGTIRLLSGNHLVVATHRIRVGKINGQDIFQLAGSEVIPYSLSTTHLNQQQNEDNKTYLRMVSSVLDTPSMYFSYEYDLTHSMQRLFNTSPGFRQMSMAERADPRFLWNVNLLQELKDSQFKRFTLPIMQGFVSINHCAINGKMFTWTLVSRRSIFRAGPRLFMRGVDHDGNVANYVETEQIIEHMGASASFVQTRGSIPLFWAQLPDLKYKPRPTLLQEEHAAACRRHLADQARAYGRQVLVNLIDQRGAEEALETGYRNVVAQLNEPSLRYESFDFHAECRHLKWDRLNILIDRLAHEQDEFSYFLLGQGGAVGAQQSGTFRTNCVDCLDRTNVVQSMLARRSLSAVLTRLDVLRPPNNQIHQHENLEMLFKRVWADNADTISVQYSGTGALKNDFTRTGKRTKTGLLRDGVNSLTRYYKNNFADGFRQDSIDLFLGHYRVREGEGVTLPCPLHKDKDWKYITFPSVLLVAMSMFCASVVLPAEYSTEILLYLMFWGAMVGSTFTIIFRYGKEFVDYPKLREITFPNQRAAASANGFPL